MAITNNIKQEFLIALQEIKDTLLENEFFQYSFEEKGQAYFIKYKKGESIIEFLFGPSDWDIEMIIFTTKGRFAFKDLLVIPSIKEWVNNNKYVQENGRNLKNELVWFIKLFEMVLPIIV